MFPIEVFQSTIHKLTSILDSLGVRYHLTGGVTGTAYGEPRMTQDIDIVVDPTRLRAVMPEFLKQIATDFIFSEIAVRAETQRGGMFQLLDKNESLKLDLYPREMISGELDRSEQLELFPNVFLPTVSRVDAACSKLIWISKGSHKSRRDFRSIYRQALSQQQTAIMALVAELGLADLALEVLNESEELR